MLKNKITSDQDLKRPNTQTQIWFWIKSAPLQLRLTAQFDPDEVFDAQVLQEDPGGGRGFEQEGDVCAQLSVEGGEVEVRRLLVEERRVPEVLWEAPWKDTGRDLWMQIVQQTSEALMSLHNGMINITWFLWNLIWNNYLFICPGYEEKSCNY